MFGTSSSKFQTSINMEKLYFENIGLTKSDPPRWDLENGKRYKVG